jgi:hypothetical protein
MAFTTPYEHYMTCDIDTDVSCYVKMRGQLLINIVMDLINVLLGNSFVNTNRGNNRRETVFSMSSAPSNSRNGVLCDQLLGYSTVLTIELCFLCGPCRSYITRFQE